MDALDTLDKSLDDLEEVLAPLFDKSLSETLHPLDLLQKAKLQVLLPYVIHDLAFIYLGTRGINPKTHPVVAELDRVKQYFNKIKKAEDPEKRKFAVDQGAAARFIKHAIKESQAAQEQAQRELKQGTHTRFTEVETVTIPSASAAALAKIQARNTAVGKDEMESEESDLEVIDGLVEETPVEEQPVKGKGKATVTEPLAPPMGKKRRRAMDLWAGFDASRDASPLTDEQTRKKAKAADSSSMTEGGSTLSADVRNAEMRVQANEAEGKSTDKDIIDVDALYSENSGDRGVVSIGNNTNSQIIDVDAIDSSRSGTPVQGKKKRKKKKKSNA